ncbi:MAG: hypothetical protein V3U60_11760 [Gammaproteobacteria bacterium]
MNNESKASRKMAVLPTSRIIGLGALGWISMLGIDFFLHAALPFYYMQPNTNIISQL